MGRGEEGLGDHRSPVHCAEKEISCEGDLRFSPGLQFAATNRNKRSSTVKGLREYYNAEHHNIYQFQERYFSRCSFLTHVHLSILFLFILSSFLFILTAEKMKMFERFLHQYRYAQKVINYLPNLRICVEKLGLAERTAKLY